LSGCTPDGFLRIFFDNIGEPVIEIESAASGNYAVWVGLWDSNSLGVGSLYISQSAGTLP